jgi:threonine synthase
MTTLTHLECGLCGKCYEPGLRLGLCPCGGLLLARYDLEKARQGWSRDWIEHGPSTIWRYAPVLPVSQPSALVSLGEGMTPLIHARRYGAYLGLTNLWIKDEGGNPTGSFKARGLSCAVSMAVELGVPRLAIASAGNAGGALAAYAAAAGVPAHVFLPRDAPRANVLECRAFGAEVTLVDGLVGDCARLVREGAASHGWFDMSAFQEPYRLEGKKTMGYEIAEQFRWTLPDVVLHPSGSGVGLIGMWKAFEEMEALAWTAGKRPRMIAVQATGCQPLVRAIRSGASRAEAWEASGTLASGLRVAKPFADMQILNAIRESGGTAVAVEDREMMDTALDLSRQEGILASPEGAACGAALAHLLKSGDIKDSEHIVILNTGWGLKYGEAYAARLRGQDTGERDKLGGLITPR